MDNQLISFIEKFFTSIGSRCIYQDKVLTITDTPQSFQKFYGKNEPYRFTLDRSKKNDEIELLDKTSYIIKTISAYLENSGQTTLLKIDFKIDPEIEIKKRLRLKNSRLIRLSPRKKFDMFFRFTFHTSFQYLNEKIKIINEIYIHDGKIINGDLNDYPVIEGKKSDIRIPDLKEPYFMAKEELKNKLQEKTKKIAEELSIKLEKEIHRIDAHFDKEDKELKENFEKAKEKLKELTEEGDFSKIDRQEKIIQNIKEKLKPDEREKDKERSILIEKNRHGLNVNNKLFNTTLIYHPICSFDALIKNQETKKIVNIDFNPLTEKLEKIKCDSCSKKTDEIYLCSNEHITCKDCFTHCGSCGKEYCKKCISTKCDLCSANICNDCKTRCFGCGKTICKTHAHLEKVTGRTYCNRCLTRCERCGGQKVGSSFRTSKKTQAKICEDCYRKEMQESTLKGVFG